MPLTFDEAARHWKDYEFTDPEGRKSLGQSRLVQFVGASGAGKDYNMGRLRAAGAHIVPSSTTREPRPDDVDKVYYSLDEALHLIEEGRVVQYAPVFGDDSIYFTLPEDFRPGVNLKDVTYDAIDTFEDRGLERVLTVGVFAPSEEYFPRIKDRIKDLKPDKVAGRLAHAAITTRTVLEWCNSDERLVIVSAKDRNGDNRQRLQRFIATGEVDKQDNQAAAAFGARMLSTIQRLEHFYNVQGADNATRLLG